MVKSLADKFFFLERFFSFSINSSKDLDDNLDTFNKCTQDITNTVEKVFEYNLETFNKLVHDITNTVTLVIRCLRCIRLCSLTPFPRYTEMSRLMLSMAVTL